MTKEMFDDFVESELNLIKKILTNKGNEYSPEIDRLKFFKTDFDGNLINNPKSLLWGMVVKHLISLKNMCLSDKKYDIEIWAEKIIDTINYLIILNALVAEEE